MGRLAGPNLSPGLLTIKIADQRNGSGISDQASWLLGLRQLGPAYFFLGGPARAPHEVGAQALKLDRSPALGYYKIKKG